MPDNLFKGLNVESILAISNGLAFLAMLLAFWLIMGVIKSNKVGLEIPDGTVTLVKLYLGASLFFVVVGAFMQLVGPSSVELRIASADDVQSLKEMKLDDKFRIMLSHNGVNQNIVQTPYAVRLPGGRENISFTANSLILLIDKQRNTISELTKNLEAKNPEAKNRTATLGVGDAAQ